MIGLLGAFGGGSQPGRGSVACDDPLCGVHRLLFSFLRLAALVGAPLGGLQVVGPFLHHRPASLKHVRAGVCRFDPPDHMAERRLG